jgi:hypothetical protein
MLFVSLAILSARAQQEITSFNVTGSGLATMLSKDYQCLGINPSNLGWKPDNMINFSIGETGLSLYSDALTKPELSDAFSLKNFGGNELTDEQKLAAARAFTSKGFAMNADELWFAASVQLPLVGGFAVSVRDRFSSYVKLNGTMADILFNGRNASYFDTINIVGNDTFGLATNPKPVSALTSGTKIYLTWYREYNFAYGRKVFEVPMAKFYAGIGLKYIQGFGIVDVDSKNGTFTAFSSFSPWLANKLNIPVDPNSPSYVGSGGFSTPVGKGYGVDIGFSAEILKVWKVGLSFNNIGSINWTGNVITVKDDYFSTTNTKGLNTYNFLKGTDYIAGNQGAFKWQSSSSERQNLPANMRLGGSYDIKKIATVGADVYVPLTDVPGNFSKPILALGGEVRPFKVLQISTGITTGGNYGFNIPFGISFPWAAWEWGIATRDILTYTRLERPNYSLVFGFLRFRIL